MTPIGRLEFEAFGATVVAELGRDLAWRCPGDAPDFLAEWLDTLYGPPLDLSPSHGAPGVPQLLAAAEDLGGRVTRLKPPRHRPGRIY